MAARKIINIGVGLDLAPLEKDAAKGQAILTTASAGMAEAATSAGDKIVQSHQKSATAVANLTKQFREAQRDAINLAAKYGQSSQAAIAAARSAGELKDKISDTKKVIDAFSNDSKFTAVAGAMSAAAGSISIVTGAMGLLGSQSEAVQQTMLKVQSAIALTQGIAQIKEMGAAFTALQAVITTSVVPSLMTLSGALVATGIGAAVVALGLFINYLNQVEASAERAKQAQKDFADSNAAIATAVNDAQQKIFKTRELQVRAMQDGYAKEAAALQLAKDKEVAATKAAFNASQKTTFDYKRLADERLAIDEYYLQQKNALNEKYTVNKKATSAIEIESLATSNPGHAAQEVSRHIQNDLKAISDKGLGVQPVTIPLDQFIKYDLSPVEQQIRTQLINMQQTLVQAAYDAGAALTSAIGESLVTGEFDFSSIMNIVAQLAQKLAMALAAIGVPLMAVPGMKLTGAAYIAGAAALGIAAGVIKGLAAKSSAGGGAASSGGGGTYSGDSQIYTPSYSSGGSTGGDMSLSTRQYGWDLLVTINGNIRKKNRV